jgi:hypothetical protein
MVGTPCANGECRSSNSSNVGDVKVATPSFVLRGIPAIVRSDISGRCLLRRLVVVIVGGRRNSRDGLVFEFTTLPALLASLPSTIFPDCLAHFSRLSGLCWRGLSLVVILNNNNFGLGSLPLLSLTQLRDFRIIVGKWHVLSPWKV